MARDFSAELTAAREAGDWDAHARIWEERRVAEVEAEEEALQLSLRAWAEPVNTILGIRYRVVEESLLFPGCRNGTNAHWASLKGARRYIRRIGKVYTPGECPLRPVTVEDRERYLQEVC